MGAAIARDSFVINAVTGPFGPYRDAAWTKCSILAALILWRSATWNGRTEMRILMATVGGSPAPIISAVRASRSKRVVFICSDGSQSTESSAGQVPDIAAKADLKSERYEIIKIPPDDPDAGILIIRNSLSDLRGRYSEAHIVADYTGGTKSMSAALLHVAIAAGLEVQFMVGQRDHLTQVRDGTERPSRLSLDFALAERRVMRLIDAWRTFGFEEAAAGFSSLYDDLAHVDGIPEAFRGRIAELRRLSDAFSAWDRFDHKEAWRFLESEPVYPELDRHRAALKRLAEANGPREPDILFDLWNNALRAAERGRYDDATARIYRLLEWTAQWMLHHHCGIDTGDVDLSKVPPSLHRHFNPDDKPITAPMGKAWALVEDMLSDRPLRHFMRSKQFAGDGLRNREPEKALG